jgi:hypothetical protein
MAQYYTLEEAAEKLGLTPDAFRKKLATEWKTTPRRYPDGATLRFKVGEVDELARTLGRASESEVPLKLADDTSSEDFVPLAHDEDALGEVRHKKPAGGSKPKRPNIGDSDVRLEPASGKTRSPGPGPLPTEEIDLDAEQRSKPPSSKKLRPKPVASEPDLHLESSSPPEGSSEFELSLAPDSSDEFDLQLSEDDSDEVDIGLPSKGLKPGDSGINLQSPADSGISLEQTSDFELQVEDEAPKKAPKTGPLAHTPAAPADSDSEFELTLDDSAASPVEATTAFPEGEQKDIFETDFELPPLDEESGSEAVALEESTDLESSDFDLAIDEGDAAAEEESDSEVVAIDDEEAPRGRRRAALAAGAEELDELDVAEDVEEREAYAPAAAEPAEWGALPAVMLIPCVLVMGLVGLMGWELLHGMWGYQQPGKVASPIVRSVAELFGEKLPPE